MDVLQCALSVVGHVEPKVRLEERVPRLGEVFDLERALEQLVLQLESQQDVHVVRDLVRLDADQRWVCPVDGAVEPFLVDSLQWLRKDRPKTRIEVTPEWLAAADQVLPQPRLRLVDAGRGAAP